MRPDQMLAEVRSALHAPPSPQAWEALCRWVDACSGPTLERVLAYAEGALRLWPDELREAPKSWLHRPRNPRRRLVRAFNSELLRRRDLKKLRLWLEGLEITALRWGFAGKLMPELYALLAHPSLHNLRILDLTDLQLVDTSALLPLLERLPITDLRLGANPELSDHALFSLLEACGSDLRHLNLDGHYFRHGLLERVRAQDARPTLRSLSLVGCHAKAETREAGMARMRELGEELGELYGVTPVLVADLPTPSQSALSRVVGRYFALPRQGWVAPEVRRRWGYARALLRRIIDHSHDDISTVLQEATPEEMSALGLFVYEWELERMISSEYWYLERYIDRLQGAIEQDWMLEYDRSRHVLELRVTKDGVAEFEYWGSEADAYIEGRGTFALDEEHLLLQQDGELSHLRVKLQVSYGGTQIRYRGRVLTQIWGNLPLSEEGAFGGVDWDAWLDTRYRGYNTLFYPLFLD